MEHQPAPQKGNLCSHFTDPKRRRPTAIALIISVIIVLWAGVSLVFVILSLISVGVGYSLAYLLVNNSDFCYSLQLIIGQFAGILKEEEIRHLFKSSKKSAFGAFEDQEKPKVGKSKTSLQQKHNIGQRLNAELEDFFESLVENYVNTWYKAEISADNAFLLEIQHQIRYASSCLLTHLKGLDFTALVLDDLAPLGVAHFERVSRLSGSENECEKKQLPLPTIELRILEQLSDLHWAMASRDNEMEYLRLIADLIVENLVDETRIGGQAVNAEFPLEDSAKRVWPSQSCRHLLRELVLFTVLIPLMDFLADPDTLNRLILVVLSSKGDALDENNDLEEPKVDFLGHFTELEQSHAPDSLLGLKLSDLVKEPRLIQLFDMYLRDIKGPTHLLDGFLQARDIHKRVRSFHTDPNSKKHAKELSEIQSDAWQLYSGFVHSNAPNQIELSSSLRAEFAAVVEGQQAAHLIEKVTEEVYKEIYQQLHFNYVIPFCQSESYLGYLCGAPPDLDQLLMRRNVPTGGSSAALKSGKPGPEASFSLSQFSLN